MTFLKAYIPAQGPASDHMHTVVAILMAEEQGRVRDARELL